MAKTRKKDKHHWRMVQTLGGDRWYCTGCGCSTVNNPHYRHPHLSNPTIEK
jgi:hypothetical protein